MNNINTRNEGLLIVAVSLDADDSRHGGVSNGANTLSFHVLSGIGNCPILGILDITL